MRYPTLILWNLPVVWAILRLQGYTELRQKLNSLQLSIMFTEQYLTLLNMFLFVVYAICEPKQNGELKFHCSNGGCIAQLAYLDQSETCSDGSDEGMNNYIIINYIYLNNHLICMGPWKSPMCSCDPLPPQTQWYVPQGTSDSGSFVIIYPPFPHMQKQSTWHTLTLI